MIRKKLLKRQLERSQIAFTKFFFRARREKFIPGDHHQLIEEAINKLEKGELYDEEGHKCKNLLITIAPRFGKTQFLSIDWPARSIARNKRAKFIHLSYSNELALDNSSKCKGTISSKEFQDLWPTKIKQDADAKQKWYTEEGGGMYATAAGGAVTGFGAGSLADVDEAIDDEFDWFFDDSDLEEDYDPNLFYGAIIIDDPIKVDDAENEKERTRVNKRLISTIASRRNSRNTPIVLVMQRLDEQDMAGFVKSGAMGERFYHLNLPAIIDEGKPTERSLWPAKHTLEELKQMKASNYRVFMSQYMQDPTPADGTFFKAEYFEGKRFRLGQEPTRLVLYGAGDYAVTEDDGDWSEQAIAGYDYQDNLWFIDWWSKQCTIDISIAQMMQMFTDHDPMLWMMEHGVIKRTMEPYIRKEQDRQKKHFKLEFLSSSKGKAANAKAFQGMCSAGKVYIPYGEWGDALIAQLLKFDGTDGGVDDKVDVCGLFGRALGMTFGPAQYHDSLKDDADEDDYGYGDEDDDNDWRTS